MARWRTARCMSRCVPVVIGHVGRAAALLGGFGRVGGRDRDCRFTQAAKGDKGKVEVVHVETPGMQDIRPGVIERRRRGSGADAFMRRACELGLAGEIDAITTTPINKEALRARRSRAHRPHGDARDLPRRPEPAHAVHHPEHAHLLPVAALLAEAGHRLHHRRARPRLHHAACIRR